MEAPQDARSSQDDALRIAEVAAKMARDAIAIAGRVRSLTNARHTPLGRSIIASVAAADALELMARSPSAHDRLAKVALVALEQCGATVDLARALIDADAE